MLRTFRLCDARIEECPAEGASIHFYINPTEDEKRYLVDVLKIDEHTLASALDPDELARLEFEPEHAALIFKRPKNYSAKDLFLFRVTSTGYFLFKDKLVCLLSEDIPLFEGKIFARTSSHHEALLKMLYRTIFHFLEHLKIINRISDELEQKINRAMENRYLLNLFTLEKSLVYYLNAIHSNAMAIEKIKHSAAKIGLAPEAVEFLDDLIVENNQCLKQAEIYANILTGLMDARGTIVGNNINVLMKTLNIITIGIMVPTFVVSAFSMNVKIPLARIPFAFWIIMGLAAVSVVGFLLFWKFRKW
ncbi:MAG: magnesium transporter CorA family protein [Candidatus Aminicenantes bacterium]|nr:magnesium transporter CorA family protein [Candidatus Aminicenantes bacterium]